MPSTDTSSSSRNRSARLPRRSLVLVTGAAGFLGGALVRRALLDGHDVVAVVRPGSGVERLDSVRNDLRIEAVELADVGAVEDLIARTRPDVVINAAANSAASAHPRGTNERAQAWRDNVTATLVLLEALAITPDSLLVHVGSGTEYGPCDLPMNEHRTGQPLTLRGVTKRAATIAVRQWAAERARPVAVVRPFSIYGPGEHPTKLVPTLLRCAASGDSFPLLAGISRRDLVHVDDVAEGCFRVAAVAATDAPIINLGTGIEHTVEEVVAAVEQATGRVVRVMPGARAVQPHDLTHWVADTSRCRDLLGWVPPTRLAEGLQMLVAGAAS